jgi:hypothetical protein
LTLRGRRTLPAVAGRARRQRNVRAVSRLGPRVKPGHRARTLKSWPAAPDRRPWRTADERRKAEEECAMTVRIMPNDKGNPPGKLAEAELHFTDGPLEGLKLIGFSIWERRGGNGRNVTFPARSYSVTGERRSFALLRPVLDAAAQNKVRELILEAFQDFEERAAIAS